MPDHFHLLVQSADGEVTALLRRLKAPPARRIVGRWRELDAAILERMTDDSGAKRFWQRGGGYDRNIETDDELAEKIVYIRANPVRRGLVNRETDWRWSSSATCAGLTSDGPVIRNPRA